MKVSEILHGDNDKTVEKLLWLIDGSTYAAEIEAIKQRLVQHGTEPTLENVKHHLVNYLLLPMELMRDPERTIILRAKRTE
jgi:hypothetical protein